MLNCYELSLCVRADYRKNVKQSLFMFQEPYNTVHYSLTGDAEALECFSINRDTGMIVSRRSLEMDPCYKDQFTVSTEYSLD